MRLTNIQITVRRFESTQGQGSHLPHVDLLQGSTEVQWFCFPGRHGSGDGRRHLRTVVDGWTDLQVKKNEPQQDRFKNDYQGQKSGKYGADELKHSSMKIYRGRGWKRTTG